MPRTNAATPTQRRRVTALAVVTLVLGLLALATPLGDAEYPASRIGALLALAAIVEALHSLRRSTTDGRRKGTVSALISMAIALFLINAPLVAAAALRLVIAGWFAVDAARYAMDIVRSSEQKQREIACHARLLVTRDYLSREITCHARLLVTRDYLSREITCHAWLPALAGRSEERY
jgi:uncharacterized membrane protein HdeD (DUF308 family)